MKRFVILGVLLVVTAGGTGASGADSPWLYGIHWFGPITNNSDVNAMTGDKKIWVLETVMTNDGAGRWGPQGQFSRLQYIVSQGHTLILRIQPVWGKAFPFPEDTAPSMAQFLDQVTQTAQLYRDVCHIWHLGNEMNLVFEWGGRQLLPETYIDAAAQFSDRIKAVQSSLGPQIVLVAPPAPGNTVEGDRFMTCPEYWRRMCQAILNRGYRNKFDGVAMHAYGNPTVTSVSQNLALFETVPGEGYQHQIGILDQYGFQDYPVYITEWNRAVGVGNAEPEYISAQFLHQAFTRMNTWNQTNHRVVCACWYVYYDEGGWDQYSIRSMKNNDDYNRDLWHAFQYACSLGYPAGALQPTPTPTPTRTPTPRDNALIFAR